MATEPTQIPVALPAPAERDKTLNLNQRMLAVMAAVGYIPKTGTGPESQGSYKFARVEHIKDAVREALVANGVMVHTSFDRAKLKIVEGERRPFFLAEVRGTMTFVNVDNPEDRQSSTIRGMATDTSDKAIGKALTAADKAGLLTAFQIPTGVDPDEVAGPGAGEHAQTAQGGRRDAGQGPGTRPAQSGPQRGSGAPSGPVGDPGPAEPGQAPARQYDVDDQGECPKHHKPWKSGTYGWYCSQKDPDTDKGYCVLKPTKEWAAAHER